MLQVARVAPKVLGESTGLVEKFLRSQLNTDGGFYDRAGRSDLYYTVFGLEGLLALQVELPTDATKRYLNQFGNGSDLDFVHLCALARCWAGLGTSELSIEMRNVLTQRIESFRAGDGGFNVATVAKFGTAYGAFLAVGAFQDLKLEIPQPLGIVQSLKFLETDDGAWANDRSLKIGSTNATAAAITVLRQLRMPINAGVGDWLLARTHAQGGFLAAPNAPMPDLLSTATALHALAGMGVSFEQIKEGCLDFVDSLWTNEGGFCGSWADATLDCEYTYYGLLALGHLSF
jgi:prenyltransferase beta subunit